MSGHWRFFSVSYEDLAIYVHLSWSGRVERWLRSHSLQLAFMVVPNRDHRRSCGETLQVHIQTSHEVLHQLCSHTEPYFFWPCLLMLRTFHHVFMGLYFKHFQASSSTIRHTPYAIFPHLNVWFPSLCQATIIGMSLPQMMLSFFFIDVMSLHPALTWRRHPRHPLGRVD